MKGLRFVIQKHAARQLHYDFRLELEGALRSWAVPKGPSLDPRHKRLAIEVEDHSLSYGDFEGLIAEGEYGAGEVIVWDAGTYLPDGAEEGTRRREQERLAAAGLAAGRITFRLFGHKLQGGWTLLRLPNRPGQWLLMKQADSYADARRNILLEDRSVLTGRTVENVRKRAE